METGGKYDHIAAMYEEIFPLSGGALDLASALAGGEGAKILDVGCGSGELALALAGLGFGVKAFDLEPSMVQRAREKGGPVQFDQGSMEEMGTLYRGERFDLISCLGNTVSHLSGPEALQDFCAQAGELLEPSGVLLLQLLNYDALLKKQAAELPEIQAGPWRFLRFYDYRDVPEALRFTTRLETASGEVVDQRTVRLYPFVRAEITEALEGAGFSKLQFYGGFDRSAADTEKLPLVVTALRP